MSEDISGLLGLGEPYHIGVAVRDVDAAIPRLDRLLGLAPWGRLDAEVDAVYRGAPAKCGIRSAFARLGDMYVELVEPTTGSFTAKTFLEERGEGIYHLGYWAEDMVGTLDKARDAGLAIDWAFPAEQPLAVYLDAEPTLGIHIELVHPATKQMIEAAIEQAER